MLYSKIFLSLLTPAAFCVSAVSASCVEPPLLKYLFSVTINIATTKVLPPVNITGGVLVVQPICNGTVSGPALNGTILGGVAYPSLYNNEALQVPTINVWGLTEDKVPFFVNELGIGSSTSQISRIQLDIGGKYAKLSSRYLLSTIMPNADHSVVHVNTFQVSA